MSGRDLLEAVAEVAPFAAARLAGAVVGELIALADDGRTPMVVDTLHAPTKAVPARSVVDLHGAHVGRKVVLVFDQGDPLRPIVMGVLQRDAPAAGGSEVPHPVDVIADEERVILDAKTQLVLRCGKACITLTRAGKILIEGSYVLSRSTGVNRVKGGSVQLN